MRVAVIGAGAAGLCAAQRLATVENEDLSFVVYEQTGNIGGTWVYTENTNVDDYGLPIHSSMYKNLRTNLPKETMEFLSFTFQHEKSFLSRTDVMKYLSDYADRYELKKYIKFYHHVVQITPMNGTWSVSVKNLQTQEISIAQFEAVMVCNGHYSEPHIPNYPGTDLFENTKMHSHSYREPECFKGKNIVIVGSGPSGVDITFDVAPFAKRIYFSHHKPELKYVAFPENVVHKSDISLLLKDSVEFQDGTVENVDTVLYCTGYNYSFPFLNEECGITVLDNFVYPLYKHFINISNPTMCFIGIPWQTYIFPLFDLQVRCFLNVLLNKVQLPSAEEMFLSLEQDIEKWKERGETTKYYHRLGNSVYEYLTDLADIFKAEPVPEVVHRVYESSVKRRTENLTGFREDVYKIIDSVNFVLNKNKIN